MGGVGVVVVIIRLVLLGVSVLLVVGVVDVLVIVLVFVRVVVAGAGASNGGGVYYGIINSLFLHMWDLEEMASLLETDDNFEIVASTVKCIYDQTCRKCGGLSRMIIFMPKDGQVVRKVQIEHSKGDTPSYMWHRKNEQSQRNRAKRQDASSHGPTSVR